MGYTPIGWQTGDTITAEKLNKMDPGWGTGTAQLFSETVTTEADEGVNTTTLAYSTPIDANQITVSFNGTDYICSKITINSDAGYGGVTSGGEFDYTDYPFAIISIQGGVNLFATETPGTFSIAVSAESIVVSDDFSAAVGSCGVNPPLRLMPFETTIDDANAAKAAGRMLYFWTQYNGCFFVSSIDGTVVFAPENSNVSAYFDRDGNFGITES